MSLPRLFLLTIILAQPLLISAQEGTDAGDAPRQKYVFAHYMTTLTMGEDYSRQEVELAQRYNIDGFALNSLTWGTWNREDDTWKLGGHGTGAQQIYDAAAALDSGFLLFNSIDVNGKFNTITRAMVDMAERFKDHPNQFWHNGELVLSAWAGRPETFAEGCAAIEARGTPVFFVPYVNNPRHMMAHSPQTVRRFYEGHPHMDGWFYFACDGLVNDMIRTNAIAARVSQQEGKLYMAGVAPSYNSPNLRDMKGMEGYSAMWEALIRDGADWVEIVTWNDYNEDSALMPGRFQSGQGRQYLSRDESPLDVTAYYAAWFKSGVKPPIAQDKVYFSYRNRPSWLTEAWDWRTGEWVDITQAEWKGLPFDQIHDDVENFVYVTAFLTAAAEVSIELGGERKAFALPAGIQHVRMPMAKGTPKVALRRDGELLAEVSGRKLIVTEATKANSPRGYHLLNRTWNNAFAVGAPVASLRAADGELAEGATLVETPSGPAVQNAETHGSGVTLPVAELSTSAYNVRVTYRNLAETEARLTMQADGPPRRERRYPYYLPLFLPPTGEAPATVSFFWSLYDTTTFLNLAWRKGEAYKPEQEAENPVFNDHGVVQILSVELIPVLPTPVPEARETTVPELVQLPGGTFTMGSSEGAKDEAPPHEVTVSPFALGTYEVTNEEFERFMPAHAEWRDEYSWRNREPVIYVSWKDAVNYCNWLSEEHGLDPAYAWDKEGRQWLWHREANGFRLPTEAEWEYAASGRGEGRTYPWGEAEPEPFVHGNFFDRDEIMDVRVVRRSQEAMGATVVGSFPAGASRDGIMDLAGNVGEWCHDWFHYYQGEAATDPTIWESPSNYRSIRGSSWGYYGLSHRVADREYNNPNYPGYIYLGFRVALPQKGVEALQARGLLP